MYKHFDAIDKIARVWTKLLPILKKAANPASHSSAVSSNMIKPFAAPEPAYVAGNPLFPAVSTTDCAPNAGSIMSRNTWKISEI